MEGSLQLPDVHPSPPAPGLEAHAQSQSMHHAQGHMAYPAQAVYQTGMVFPQQQQPQTHFHYPTTQTQSYAMQTLSYLASQSLSYPATQAPSLPASYPATQTPCYAAPVQSINTTFEMTWQPYPSPPLPQETVVPQSVPIHQQFCDAAFPPLHMDAQPPSEWQQTDAAHYGVFPCDQGYAPFQWDAAAQHPIMMPPQQQQQQVHFEPEQNCDQADRRLGFHRTHYRPIRKGKTKGPRYDRHGQEIHDDEVATPNTTKCSDGRIRIRKCGGNMIAWAYVQGLLMDDKDECTDILSFTGRLPWLQTKEGAFERTFEFRITNKAKYIERWCNYTEAESIKWESVQRSMRHGVEHGRMISISQKDNMWALRPGIFDGISTKWTKAAAEARALRHGQLLHNRQLQVELGEPKLFVEEVKPKVEKKPKAPKKPPNPKVVNDDKDSDLDEDASVSLGLMCTVMKTKKTQPIEKKKSEKTAAKIGKKETEQTVPEPQLDELQQKEQIPSAESWGRDDDESDYELVDPEEVNPFSDGPWTR